MIDINKNYWLYIESYVYRRIENDTALLYNTIDSLSIQNSYSGVLDLLYELSAKDNCGVIKLTGKQLRDKNIVDFVNDSPHKLNGINLGK